MAINWSGVFPAITTKFHEDESIDFDLTAKNIEFQLRSGVHGLIALGSLGENSVMDAEEKQTLLKHIVKTVAGRVPVVATVAENTTRRAIKFVEDCVANGADGFMLLPGMMYIADSREIMTHFRSVAAATDKDIMIYNNPIAYRMDTTPEMFAELADVTNITAIKESSDNIRRITDIINLTGDRYSISCGVDDLAMEALILGAKGWVAGLVCAFPAETVAIYNLVQEGRINEAREIYRWFMPLLHLDVNTKLVQNIKLAEKMVGQGSEFVRAPRLQLTGDELASVTKVIEEGIKNRPDLSKYNLKAA